MKRLTITLFLILSLSFVDAENITFYVAPKGNDTNPGTIALPFATLGKARDAIREYKTKSLKGGEKYVIRLRGGIYYFDREVVFDERDQGSSDNSVLIENQEHEKVVFSGGVTLPSNAFRLVTEKKMLDRLRPEARGKVYEFDLKSNNVSYDSTLTRQGFAHDIQPSSCRVFFNKEFLTLARWPNEGKLPIGKVIDPGSKPRWEKNLPPRGASFRYDYDRAKTWNKANDIWIYGIFSNGYSDDNIQVKSFDTKKKILTTVQPHIYGVYSTNDSSNWDVASSRHLRGYYVYNLPEELDIPGEYYIDRKEGKLYLWPPSSIEVAEIELSQNTSPLLILYNTSNITIRGISFECSRGMGIYMDYVSNIHVDNCVFRNLGLMAVSFGDKYHSVKLPVKNNLKSHNTVINENNLIENCTIYNMGSGAIHLQGGDRTLLKPGKNIVDNCEIYQYCRINHSGVTAITVGGVGNTISHCYIHDSENMAVYFKGNNHILEYSHIKNVCTTSSDAGSVYAGRNPSEQGTVIRYNFFESITHPKNMVCAIYLDDGTCGYRIYSNVFYRCGTSEIENGFGAFHINGGFGNYMANNVFVECKKAYNGTSWSDTKWVDYLTHVVHNKLKKEVNIESEIFQNAYPMLKTLRDTINFPLRINYTSNDLLYNCQKYSTGMWQHNICFRTLKDPGFIDAERQDFNLKENSVVFKAIPGFLPIPFSEIGIRKQ